MFNYNYFNIDYFLYIYLNNKKDSYSKIDLSMFYIFHDSYNICCNIKICFINNLNNCIIVYYNKFYMISDRYNICFYIKICFINNLNNCNIVCHNKLYIISYKYSNIHNDYIYLLYKKHNYCHLNHYKLNNLHDNLHKLLNTNIYY